MTPRRIGKVAVIGRTANGEALFAALRDAGVSAVLIESDALFSDSHCPLLDDTDLAIETISGDREARRAVLERLGQLCSAHAVLATAGADLNPRPVFKDLPHPDRLVGLHVFDPERPVQLLEIVPTPLTSKETVSTLFSLARLINRIPVQAGRCDSFIRNRLLMSSRREAERLVREGTPKAAIDAAARALGLEIGPFETQDAASADAQAAGQDQLPADEILARLSGAMATEGKAMLADGTALQASDIDLVAIHLCGYPRWRGGPMFASDRPR